MSIADIYMEELEGKHFSSRQEYETEVSNIATDLIEEIGDIERSLLKFNEKDLYESDITID